MKPTVGRIVQYTPPTGETVEPQPRAALITDVRQHTFGTMPVEEDNYDVSLCVFFKTGNCWLESVRFTIAEAGTEPARGKWAWPKKEST